MRRVLLIVVLAGCVHESAEQRDVVSPRTVMAQAPAAAPRVPPAPVTGLSATAQSLALVDMFAIGGVGFAGAESNGKRLTLELAREPNAIEMFEKLAAHPNRVARLYAYWALKTLDASRAATFQQALLKDTTQVQAAHGCMIDEQPAHELASEIDRWPQTAMPRP
jgi:hypothetical protein